MQHASKSTLSISAKNARVYITDGARYVTASPTQKAALTMTIRSLALRAQAIANGTLFIADELPIQRQVEMTLDAMKVGMTEHKKMGFMWGLDGKLQQAGYDAQIWSRMLSLRSRLTRSTKELMSTRQTARDEQAVDPADAPT